jgi:hypothetical protein
MHQAWISVDLVQTVTGCLLWQRLEARMLEMKDRRRQLAKAIAKQEGHEEQFDKMYDEIINSKTLVMQKYSSLNLEECLKGTTKNIALELVTILMDTGVKRGILVCLEKKRFKYFTKMMKGKQPENITLKPSRLKRKEKKITSSIDNNGYVNQNLFHKSMTRSSQREISKDNFIKNDKYNRHTSYGGHRNNVYRRSPALPGNNFER